jgi:exopolysaccharide biosynthesis polyprenyl glycosylphosphotransferase
VTAVTLTESREGPLPWFPDAAAALDEDEGVGRPVDAAGFRASGGLPVYPLAALPALLRGEAGGPPPDVLVVTPSTAGEDKARVAALAALAGARLLIVPSYRDLLVLDTRMTQIDDTLAFEVGPSGIPAHLAWAKRLMDIGFALAGLALTLPLYPLVAAAVALSSPGPVFYRQARVGLGGRVYTMWKFRTMVADAEAATGAVLAKADDPRVTPVGRVLRRFRLDELPQLLNVLAGSMSVVGPRPERPEFAREYARMVPYYEHRHHLKPGLTGLAQLSVRYDTPVEEKLRYDLLYAKRYSLLLDLRIIFLTAKVVLMGEEAHWTPES